jgi:hypothetical protein
MKNLKNLFLIEYSSARDESLTKPSYEKINEIINKIKAPYNLESGLYVIIPNSDILPNQTAPDQIAGIVNEIIRNSETIKYKPLWPEDDKINEEKEDLIKKIHKKIEDYDNVLITAHSMVLGRIRTYFLKEVCNIKKTNSYELNQKAKTKCIHINLKEKNYDIIV